MELKRFLIASIRLIIVKDKIQILQSSKDILIPLNPPVDAILFIEDKIKELQHLEKLLKAYILRRYEWVMLESFYEYDIKDFRFLTKKDIDKGYIALDDNMSSYLLLANGKIVNLQYIQFAESIPSPIKEFNLIRPL